MEIVNLKEKFTRIPDYWHPRIAGRLNGQEVRLAKLKGEFVWHMHEAEDELFLVVAGRLFIDFRDRTAELGPGEFIIVPRGVEHRPRAEEETHILLFEPASTVNTGAAGGELTRESLEEV